MYFVDEPTDADVVPGGIIQFHCKAKNNDQFVQDQIKWFKNDQILHSGLKYEKVQFSELITFLLLKKRVVDGLQGTTDKVFFISADTDIHR